MSHRRKSDRCSSCGSAETVEAIDNHGQPYVGCAHCCIAAGDTKSVGTYASELATLRAQLAQVTAERDAARHAHACAEEIGDVVKRALVRTRRSARAWKAVAKLWRHRSRWLLGADVPTPPPRIKTNGGQ